MLDIRGTKTEENIEKEICEKAKLSVRLRLYGRQAEKMAINILQIFLMKMLID